MRKMRRFLYLLLLMTLIVSCSENENRKQLNDIEQLLKQQKNEEACKLLNNMNPEELEDDEDVYALCEIGKPYLFSRSLGVYRKIFHAAKG